VRCSGRRKRGRLVNREGHRPSGIETMTSQGFGTSTIPARDPPPPSVSRPRSPGVKWSISASRTWRVSKLGFAA